MSDNFRRLVRPIQYSGQINLSQRRAWFETSNPPPAESKPQTPAPVANDAGVSGSEKPETFDRAYVEELRKENATWRKQTREMEKRLEAIESEKKQSADAELASQQKFKELAEQRERDLAALKSQLETERLTNLRTRIGVELKLPVLLAMRLQGTTEDDIRADAESLVKELGLNKSIEPPPAQNQQAPAQNPAGRQTTAVAPGGPPATETDEQRRARLYKRGASNSPLFNKTS